MDYMESLDPVGAVIARHDKPQWKSIEDRQILSVHGISQHHLAVARMIDVQRLGKVRSLVADRTVHAAKHHLLRAGLNACLVQHRLQRNTFPSRITHSAIAKLPARTARHDK